MERQNSQKISGTKQFFRRLRMCWSLITDKPFVLIMPRGNKPGIVINKVEDDSEHFKNSLANAFMFLEGQDNAAQEAKEILNP